MDRYPVPTEQFRPVGTIFFIFIHLIGIVGTPLYIYFYGLTWQEFSLFVFYYFATNMAITAGYHRLFSHATYKSSRIIKFLLLFFGAATFQRSALKWASQHRQHHQFTDTDQDPYNINKGFWYAHAGWITSWKHQVNRDVVKDLADDKLVWNQHKNYGIWSIAAGMLLPMTIGFMIGRPLGVFVMSICLRLVIVFNAAFFINSYTHTFGSQPFGKDNSARDHWLGALLTNGEGYHNFHHRFPQDYRNGIKWYHWDPTKWFIFTLSKLHLASELIRIPPKKIEASKQISG